MNNLPSPYSQLGETLQRILQKSGTISQQSSIIYEAIVEGSAYDYIINLTPQGNPFKLQRLMIFLSIPKQDPNTTTLPDVAPARCWTSVYLYSKSNGGYSRNITLNGYSQISNTYGVLVAECAGDIVAYKGTVTDDDGDSNTSLTTRLRPYDFEPGRPIVTEVDEIRIQLQYSEDGITKLLPLPEGTYIRIVGTQSLENN